MHERVAKGMEVLQYYATNQWDFDNKIGNRIRQKMNKKEKIIYKCDAEGVDVYKYFENCILGARRYLLRQPDDRLPAARRMMTV